MKRIESERFLVNSNDAVGTHSAEVGVTGSNLKSDLWYLIMIYRSGCLFLSKYEAPLSLLIPTVESRDWDDDNGTSGYNPMPLSTLQRGNNIGGGGGIYGRQVVLSSRLIK